MFKRERLAGTWAAPGQKRAPKPIQPGTVNRELDTLKCVLAWAVKEKKLIASPAVEVAHQKTRNVHRAGITDRDVTPHTLRHTASAAWWRRGATITPSWNSWGT